MKRLVKQIAEKSAVTTGEAADQLDKVIHDILRKLRNGERAPVPGVGVLTPGRVTKLVEEIESSDAVARTRR